MKKCILLALLVFALIMSVSYADIIVPVENEDISRDFIFENKVSSWAKEEVKVANYNGLIPGNLSDQDLRNNITREEFAAIAVCLYEKLTGQKAEAVDNPFEDTSNDYVLKAYGLGITTGTSKDTFTPRKLVTREQLATMMYRTLSKSGIDTSVDINNVNKFSDDNNLHDWSREAVYYMSNIEIIKGIGDNKFGVSADATREQAILISLRSLNKFCNKTNIVNDNQVAEPVETNPVISTNIPSVLKVKDNAKELTDEQINELNSKLLEYTEKYDINFVLLSITENTGVDVSEYAEYYFKTNKLADGYSNGGIMLLSDTVKGMSGYYMQGDVITKVFNGVNIFDEMTTPQSSENYRFEYWKSFYDTVNGYTKIRFDSVVYSLVAGEYLNALKCIQTATEDNFKCYSSALSAMTKSDPDYGLLDAYDSVMYLGFMKSYLKVAEKACGNYEVLQNLKSIIRDTIDDIEAVDIPDLDKKNYKTIIKKVSALTDGYTKNLERINKEADIISEKLKQQKSSL